MKLELSHPSMGIFSLPLREGRSWILGRDCDEADVELRWDLSVSRQHARVWVSNGEVWLEDSGSSNGCWCGTRRLRDRTRLDLMGPVRVGSTLVSVVPNPASPWAEATEVALPEPSSSVHDDALPSVELVGNARVRVEGAGLQALWSRDLSERRLHVPGPSSAEVGAPLMVDINLEDGLVSIAGWVVGVSASGTELKLDHIPLALVAAIEDGIDETTYVTVEIEPPVELFQTPEPPAPLELAETLIRRVASGDLYGALGLDPMALDEAVQAQIEAIELQLADPDAIERFGDLLDPVVRAVAIIQGQIGEPLARLRYDFSQGYFFPEHRRDLAARQLGPSLDAISALWRRTFPAKSDRARALWRVAARADELGRHEEARDLRAQARLLSPFELGAGRSRSALSPRDPASR